MKAFVVYESMYGNTHQIAAAIAEGLAPLGEVEVGAVSEISPESIGEAELVVVGGPTHVHGMSRASSRKAAVAEADKGDELDAEPGADGPGLREWFAVVPDATREIFAAGFDTRIDKPVIFTGSAAKGIAKQLRRHRFTALADPESFLVEDSEGPLKGGELDRALRWGGTLADHCRDLVGT